MPILIISYFFNINFFYTKGLRLVALRLTPRRIEAYASLSDKQTPRLTPSPLTTLLDIQFVK